MSFKSSSFRHRIEATPRRRIASFYRYEQSANAHSQFAIRNSQFAVRGSRFAVRGSRFAVRGSSSVFESFNEGHAPAVRASKCIERMRSARAAPCTGRFGRIPAARERAMAAASGAAAPNAAGEYRARPSIDIFFGNPMALHCRSIIADFERQRNAFRIIASTARVAKRSHSGSVAVFGRRAAI
ncbi:hypothetical protein [Burkholderia pseudomallei]|uniref:hypothetical protein n=1 Tax=Burkholderia pseudomallei TaxID=28450 RepID=UPI0021F73FC7|nr:hypothetical protein [Burkholderia pseudomallei]MCV9973451.1 hypothetical protein [Burkholderia pseudomallei]